jgi:hypothetical protein
VLELFQGIEEIKDKEFKIKISYLEIYNEQVKDLLNQNSASLVLFDDPVKGIIALDLTEWEIHSEEQVYFDLFRKKQFIFR